MTQDQYEKLTDDILEMLTGLYINTKGEVFQGQAISTLHKRLKDGWGCEAWTNLGRLNRFQDTIEDLGFKVVQAWNKRNQPCRVVTL